jgi:hypothetical protein
MNYACISIKFYIIMITIQIFFILLICYGSSSSNLINNGTPYIRRLCNQLVQKLSSQLKSA